MYFQRISRVGLIATLATWGVWCGLGTAVAAPTVLEDRPEGTEVLARGPVHEAFAETVTFDPQPGVVVPKTPPAAIEELPPEQKPEGNNVAWIPGYWAWDDDGSDFLWVSGMWRALPPGRQWVSGYWAQSGKGAQWISGYWADAGLTEVEYLPEPPESIESGPNVDAPSADHIWLPGCWVWQQNRYAWRPGFWTPAHENWIWTPAHYQSAPRGYVYVDGYWDYAVQRRGVLFAPVSFQQSVYSQRGFSYTPSTVIDLGVFANHLFVRPNYNHYYYGDYYGANYAKTGFYSSFSFNSGRHGYDPIYAQQRWNHRQDKDWERRVQSGFQHRREHEEARPPRMFAAQQELVKKGLTEQDQGRVFARPLSQYTQAKDNPLRFQPLNDDDRQRFNRLRQEIRTHRDQRQKLETAEGDPTVERPDRTSEPARVKFSRSPLVGKGADELGKDYAPPKTYDLPKPDARIVPKPRAPFGQGRTPPSNRQPTPRVDPRQPQKVGLQPKAEPPKVAPKPQPQPQPPKVAPKPQPRDGGRQEKPQGGRPTKPKP